MKRYKRIFFELPGLCLLLFFSFCGMFSYAQQVSRSVISPLGTSTAKNGIYLSQTAGQPSAYTQAGDENTGLRQGFQQPLVLHSDVVNKTVTITVYPSPNDGSFSFITDLPRNCDFSYAISDASGRELHRGSGTGQSESFVTLSDSMASGTYYLSIYSENLSGSTEIVIIH